MPEGVALGSIYAAIRSLLLESTDLDLLLARDARSAFLPAVYVEGAVPQGATFPYVTMGAGTQQPFHTMGPDRTSPRWGWNCTLQLKVVGQGDGEDEILAIMDAVGKVVYEGRDLIASGSPGSPGLLTEYGYGWCDDWALQPTIVSIVQGRATRELPAILRVFVHD